MKIQKQKYYIPMPLTPANSFGYMFDPLGNARFEQVGFITYSKKKNRYVFIPGKPSNLHAAPYMVHVWVVTKVGYVKNLTLKNISERIEVGTIFYGEPCNRAFGFTMAKQRAVKNKN